MLALITGWKVKRNILWACGNKPVRVSMLLKGAPYRCTKSWYLKKCSGGEIDRSLFSVPVARWRLVEISGVVISEYHIETVFGPAWRTGKDGGPLETTLPIWLEGRPCQTSFRTFLW